MTRILFALLAMLWLAPAAAQPTTVIPRVGMLVSTSAEGGRHGPQLLRDALREKDWVDGKTAVLDVRAADRDQARLPALAADLVLAKVNVIVALGTAATRAAREATSTIPIVMVNVGDPLGSGFVESLARPGGNTTGVAGLLPEISAKGLEILKEAVPHLRKVGIFRTGVTRGSGTLTLAALEDAAQRLGVQLQPFSVQGPADLAAQFQGMRAAGMDAYLVLVGPTIDHMRVEIAAQALQHKFPGIAAARDYAESGILLYYGTSTLDIITRAAAQVDRILKGASPAELPVEQPDKFHLTINLSTAAAIGLKVPESLLARADEVIE